MWALLAMTARAGTATATATGTEVTLATSLVPTSFAPASTVPALTGGLPIGPEAAPRLRIGLAGRAEVALPADSSIGASWGLWRDQALCDTCAGGRPPGRLGSELLGSSDLTIRLDHREPLGEDGAGLIVRLDAVLPASRDALACNPMVAAPGAGAIFDLPVRESRLAVTVGARRPFFRFQAAPVGRCSPELRGQRTVDALTGPVEPTPWDAEWFGASNPSLAGSATLNWIQPHTLLGRVPRALRSAVQGGLRFERSPAGPSFQIETLTGSVEVPGAVRPVRTTVPWEVELGWAFSRIVEADLSVGNQVPTVLTDPGGTFRAVPATTTYTAAVTARL